MILSKKRLAKDIHAACSLEAARLMRYRFTRYYSGSRSQSKTQRQLYEAMIHARDYQSMLDAIESLKAQKMALRNASQHMGRPTTTSLPQIATEEEILGDLKHIESHYETSGKPPKQSITIGPISIQGIDLGKYSISIYKPMESPEIRGRILVIRRYRGEWDELQHPHVSSGYPCMGPSSAAYCEMVAFGRILDALRMIENLLHSYNPEQAYINVEHFSEKPFCYSCNKQVRSTSHLCDYCMAAICKKCSPICKHCG